MNVIELQRALRQLRCSGMAAGLEARLLEAQAEKLVPLDFLSHLVQDELVRRQDRLLERRVKQAGFRDPGKRLDTFDFDFNKKMNRKLVFELATARFVARKLVTHFVADHPPPALVDRVAQAFRASDGHFTVGASNDKLWPLFCGLLGLASLVTDPRFATLAGLGIWHITREPGVLAAVNPLHAVRFFADNGGRAFLVRRLEADRRGRLGEYNVVIGAAGSSGLGGRGCSCECWEFLRSDRLQVTPNLFSQSETHRRVLLALSMTSIVNHLKTAIRDGNTESRRLVLDESWPVRSTGDMRPWYTSRPCESSRALAIRLCRARPAMSR